MFIVPAATPVKSYKATLTLHYVSVHISVKLGYHILNCCWTNRHSDSIKCTCLFYDIITGWHTNDVIHAHHVTQSRFSSSYP